MRAAAAWCAAEPTTCSTWTTSTMRSAKSPSRSLRISSRVAARSIVASAILPSRAPASRRSIALHGSGGERMTSTPALAERSRISGPPPSAATASMKTRPSKRYSRRSVPWMTARDRHAGCSS